MLKYVNNESIKELLKKNIETLVQSKDINAAIQKANFVTADALKAVLKNIQNGYALKSEIPAITTVHGESAYEEAVKLGKFEGTEEEYLASLKGEKGDKGDIGPDGKSAYDLAKEFKGFEGTPEEYLASLKGEKGDSLPQESLCDALRPYAPENATNDEIFEAANDLVSLIVHTDSDKLGAALFDYLKEKQYSCTSGELLEIFAKYPVQINVMSRHLRLVDVANEQDKRIKDNNTNINALGSIIEEMNPTLKEQGKAIESLETEKDLAKNRLAALEDPAKQVTITANMYQQATQKGFQENVDGLTKFTQCLYNELHGIDSYEAAQEAGFTGTKEEWAAIVEQDVTLKAFVQVADKVRKDEYAPGFHNAVRKEFDASKPDTWMSILASYVIAQDGYGEVKVDGVEAEDYYKLAQERGFTGSKEYLDNIIEHDITSAYLSAYAFLMQQEINEHSDMIKTIAKGVTGKDGRDGAPGKSSYDLYVESLGADETPMPLDEWIEKLQSGPIAKEDFHEITEEEVINIFRTVEDENEPMLYGGYEAMTDKDIYEILGTEPENNQSGE